MGRLHTLGGWSVFFVCVAGCETPTPVQELIADGPVAGGQLTARQSQIEYIDSTRALQDHIGDENAILVLATRSTDPGGNYVIPACAHREEETTNPYCGQMTMGYGTALVGALMPQMRGAYPTGRIARPGPTIDCSAETNFKTDWDPDDGNGWRLACLQVSAGIVWGVAIDNGEVDPQQPEQGSHRNGIFVAQNDGTTLVGRDWITDVRRGVLQGANTDVSVFETVVDGTELAGVFSTNGDFESDSPPKALDGGVMRVDVSRTRLENIGLWSVIFLWGVGGDDVESDASYEHLWVDDGSSNDFLAYGNSYLDPTPITHATARFTIDDSRLEAADVGLRMVLGGDSSNSENSLVGDVTDTTFANAGGNPVLAVSAPWDQTLMLLGMTGDAYRNDSAGTIAAVCIGCSDTTPRWQLAGTRDQFLEENDNFDVSALDDALFTGEPLP